MKSSVLKLLKGVWKQHVPQGLKNRLIPKINQYHHNRMHRKALIQIDKIGQSKLDTLVHSGPLIVSAFFDEPLGIGRGGHCSFDAFETAGLNPIRHDLRPILNTHAPFTHTPSGKSGRGVHFIHCNPPEVLSLIRALDPATYAHNYRIGYWAYELPRVPRDWIKISQFFHEIWVPSEFVKTALIGAHCPVKVMPHDVLTSLTPFQPKYKGFGVSKNKFTILVAGDLRSSAARKNLEGSLEIFTKAFPEPNERVQLVVKLSKVEVDPKTFKRLKYYDEIRDDIILIPKELPYEDVMSLMQACDLLLSAHRSEGYGLMLAEAIALGKQVLATGWSGNLEFMSDVPNALLPYELVSVDDPTKIYAGQDGQVWADVDIDQAALILANIADQNKSIDLSPAQERLKVISQMWKSETLKQMEFATHIEI